MVLYPCVKCGKCTRSHRIDENKYKCHVCYTEDKEVVEKNLKQVIEAMQLEGMTSEEISEQLDINYGIIID